MRKTSLLCFILWLLPIAVHAQDSIPVSKLRVDPTNAMGGTAANIFQQVAYIPLETTKESLFGEINQLLVTGKYFIILDHSTNAVLFFDKTGKFHHKINRFDFDRVFKPDPRPGIRNITIFAMQADPEKAQLYIQTVFERASLYIYNFDGTRIGKVPLPPNTGAFHLLKDGTGVYMQDRPMSKSEVDRYAPFDLSIYRKPNAKPLHLLPVDFRYVALGEDLHRNQYHLTSSGNPWQCFYLPDFDYRVYELDTAGIRRTYQFILPHEYSMPDHFGYDSSYTGRRREYLKDKAVFTNIWNLYKTGDYLLIDLRCPSPKLSSNWFTLLYSLRTNRLITLDRIGADVSTCWLPVSGYGRSEMLACDGNSFYFSYSSLMMFAAKTDAEGKQATYTPALQNYFSTQNRKANPVILQLIPKANL